MMRRCLLVVTLLMGALFLTGFVPAGALEVETEYKPGRGFALRTTDGNNELIIGGYVQGRFIYNWFRWPDNPSMSHQANWRVQRARLDFRGHVVTPKLTFRLEFDLTRATEINLDMWANYRFWDELQVKVGRFKVPYNRHELSSSSSLQFIERSQVNKFPRDFISKTPDRDFALEYNLGASIHGRAWEERIEYHLGIFNGQDNHFRQTALEFGEYNPNFSEMLYIARVMFCPLGYVPYTDSDLAISTTPKFALGGAYFFEKSVLLQVGNSNLADITSYVVDLAFRWQGLSINGEMLSRTWKHHYEVPRYGRPGFTMDAIIAQAGYLLPVWARRIEVCGRYARLKPQDPDQGFAAFVDQREAEREYGGAVNVYFAENRAKLSADYLIFITEFAAANQTAERRKQLRVQLQVKL
jgi:phosphate-selective porin OprO and OprP